MSSGDGSLEFSEKELQTVDSNCREMIKQSMQEIKRYKKLYEDEVYEHKKDEKQNDKDRKEIENLEWKIEDMKKEEFAFKEKIKDLERQLREC